MTEAADAYADEKLRSLLLTIAMGEVFTMRQPTDIAIGRRMRRKLKEVRDDFGIDGSVGRYVDLLIEGTWAARHYALGNPGARKCALDALVALDEKKASNQESPAKERL